MLLIRHAEPEDHGRVAAVVDEWWDGRAMAAMLPKLVGTDPARRGSGLGRALYERFFDAVSPRSTVRAVISPVNERSVAFHQALGFEIERIDPGYDGAGEPRVLLVKRLP